MQKRIPWVQLKRVVTLRTFLTLCMSLGASAVLTLAFLDRVAPSSGWFAPAMGLVISLVLTGALFLVLRCVVDEFIVCDAALRRLVLALIVSGAVVAALFAPVYPRTLTWRWAAGPHSGDIAPVFSGTSWDGVARRVIELHATNNPETTPHGVWRAVADLSDPGGVLPVTLELWVTQPLWAVIDPAMNAPPPNLDGVDVIVHIEKGGAVLSEQRIPLDPPVASEQRSWRRVVVDLPADAERLSVEVAMRQTPDSDRVWVTEATVRPFWEATVGRGALVLLTVLAASTLVFLRRLPLVVQGAQRLASFFASWGWLLVGVNCLWLAYMVVWQRGLFLDDWTIGSLARDRETLEWKSLTISRDTIPTFPARILTFIVTPHLVALMWTDEFIVRLLITICVGVNALLLGWLVHRMTRKKLAAVVAGWLFLVPTVCTDVTLWAGAVTYIFISGLTLLVLHIAWSIIATNNSLYLWLVVAGVLWLLTLFWAEATIGALGLMPVMAFMRALQKPGINTGKLIRRVSLLNGSLLGITGLFVLFVLNNSPLVHGGFYNDIEMIIRRIVIWSKEIYWLTISPEWGFRFAIESFWVGFGFVIKDRYGYSLFLALIFFLVLTVAYWKDDRSPNTRPIEVLGILLLGLSWFFLIMYFPYVFLVDRLIERRFLYFPFAAVAVILSALILLIRRDFVQKLALALFGPILVILSCCSVGYSRLFAVQYETDVRIFYSIREMVDPQRLPQEVLFIPVNLDFWLPDPEYRLNGMMVSAFEASWSGRAGNAFVLRGARPVFADIRPDTLNIDETKIEALITPRTRAIVPVHYAGVGCEMEEICALAERYGIAIVEDNAHGLFGKYRGRLLGTFGTFGTLSFHETKNLNCGEGGALIINDPAYVERAEIIREKGTNRSSFFRGQVDKYTWVDIGSSYLPSDLLAAYLLAQLEAREQVLTARRRVFEYYQQHLSDWALTQGVQLPFVPDWCEPSYHLFYMLLPSLEDRSALIAHLRKRGIMTAFHYLPLHLSPVGRSFGYCEGDCPITEDVSDRLLRLPFYNDLTADDLSRIVEAIQNF